MKSVELKKLLTTTFEQRSSGIMFHHWLRSFHGL